MSRTPVLIDCDTGIDDIISLVLALRSPRLDVLGITTVAGNQGVEKTTQNTLNALELLGRGDIALAAGAARPLARPLFDAGYIHGENGLGGYVFEKPTEKQPVVEPAWDFLYERLHAAGEPVTIIALGPLTNIALLLQKYPECKAQIREIVFMGGSIRIGNPTPVATFNVLVDPEAAKEVIASRIPFTMCSLECTRESYFLDEELDAIARIDNPAARMVKTVTDHYRRSTAALPNFRKRFRGLCIHDLCTVASVTNPEFFSSQQYFADVETRGELTTGFTLVDYEDILGKPEAEKTVKFLMLEDRDAYIRLFMDTLKQY